MNFNIRLLVALALTLLIVRVAFITMYRKFPQLYHNKSSEIKIIEILLIVIAFLFLTPLLYVAQQLLGY